MNTIAVIFSPDRVPVFRQLGHMTPDALATFLRAVT